MTTEPITTDDIIPHCHPDPAMSGVRHLFTAAEAQEKLGIPASTVRTWAQRHRIYSYGLTETGKPMYDRDDLVALRDRHVARRAPAAESLRHA